jgi:hypothetical protein
MLIEISDETVIWVKQAVEGFDPITAPPAAQNLKMWACYAVRNAIEKAERQPADEPEDDKQLRPLGRLDPNDPLDQAMVRAWNKGGRDRER